MLIHPSRQHRFYLALICSTLVFTGLVIFAIPRAKEWYDHRGDNTEATQATEDPSLPSGSKRMSGLEVRQAFAAAQEKNVALIDAAVQASVAESNEARNLRISMEQSMDNASYWIGSRYGMVGQKRFSTLYNYLFGLLTSYGKALSSQDVATVEGAKSQLDGWPAMVGGFVTDVKPGSTSSEVEKAATGYVNSYRELIELRSKKQTDTNQIETVRNGQVALTEALSKALLAD